MMKARVSVGRIDVERRGSVLIARLDGGPLGAVPPRTGTGIMKTCREPAIRVMAAAALLVGGATTPAMAYEAGDWVARAGLHYVDPKSDNHDTVGVEPSGGLTGSISRFLTPQFAMEMLVAAPFEHDITLNGSGDTVASTQHLPPTLSLVWYPEVGGRWHPFIGAGLNYTLFFNEDTEGALAGSKLELDDSFGVAAVAGVDVDIDRHWGLALDLRYMDIDTDATLDGTDVGTVEIDPLGFGFTASYRF